MTVCLSSIFENCASITESWVSMFLMEVEWFVCIVERSKIVFAMVLICKRSTSTSCFNLSDETESDLDSVRVLTVEEDEWSCDVLESTLGGCQEQYDCGFEKEPAAW